MYIMTSRPRTRVFRPGPVWGCDRLVSRAKVIENQVMAAPIISISFDSSKESVGSDTWFPAEVPIAPVDLKSLHHKTSRGKHESLTPSSEFSLAPVVAPPGIRRWPTILVRPDEAIPFGRPYHIHPNGPRKLLTTRKRVVHFLARRLAWRRISYRFFQNRHSSQLRLFNQTHLLQFHLQTLHAYFIRSAPLSTLYLPTTSESSLDSSSERSLDSSSPSARPSRKRCRSPTTLVLSSTPVSRLIAPAPVDLPPRKRFRDSYSSEVSREEHMEMGTANAETVADLGISEGVRAHTEDCPHYMPERVGLADRVRSLGRENLRVQALLYIERDRVDSLRRHMALSQEEFRQVRRDRDDTWRRLRRLESLVERRFGFHCTKVSSAREGTLTRFQEGSTTNFKGNEGVVRVNKGGIEEDGNIFHINNCPEKYQVKYATAHWTEIQEMVSWTVEFDCEEQQFGCLYSKIPKAYHVVHTKNGSPRGGNELKSYVRGLPDNIQRNVIVVEPTRLQDVVRIANNLMDQKLKGYAVKNAENKRKFDNSQKDNRGQQPPFKRQNVGGQNVARAYTLKQ
ncbi:hypothetical protein Tco_0936344 [Tanacetum coccineum]